MKLKAHRRFITMILFISVFLIAMTNLIVSGENLIHKNGLKALKEIVLAMFNPDLSPMILKLALEAVFQTLAYAAAGISIAIIVGFLLAIPSSEIFSSKKAGINIAKHILAFMRGIHEIIWAWFFVASIGLTPFSAILAIAIPYAGTLGKIFSDILSILIPSLGFKTPPSKFLYNDFLILIVSFSTLDISKSSSSASIYSTKSPKSKKGFSTS